jgi:hypothetical protein
LRKRIVCLAVDNRALFDPADLVFFSPHFEESAAVLKNLERLPVHDLSHALRNGCNAVVKIHLARRDVDGFVLLMAKAAAPRSKHGNARRS